MSDRLKGKDLLSGLSRTTTALTLIALLGCLPVEGTNSCEGAYPNQAMSGTTDVCLPINGGVPIPRAEFTDPTAVPTQEPSSIIPSHLEPVLVGGVEGYRVSGGDGVIPRAEFTDPRP